MQVGGAVRGPGRGRGRDDSECGMREGSDGDVQVARGRAVRLQVWVRIGSSQQLGGTGNPLRNSSQAVRNETTYRLVAFSFDDDAFAGVHSALDLDFDALLVRDRTLAFAFLAPGRHSTPKRRGGPESQPPC